MAVNPQGSAASLLHSFCTPPGLVPDGVLGPTGAFDKFLAKVKEVSLMVGGGELSMGTIAQKLEEAGTRPSSAFSDNCFHQQETRAEPCCCSGSWHRNPAQLLQRERQYPRVPT